ncbi:MAG: iron-containing redox enzyme family protein [Candidatus Thermoplasmatota archaeon]|nr:iron-containing redox enzyme family protein [Candidatus Thermoplasmatota archaeon]
MSICPVCLEKMLDLGMVSQHMSREASVGDEKHVAWLHRNISSTRISPPELRRELERFLRVESDLKSWFISRFIHRFFSNPPHTFIAKMQKPTKEVIAGYAIEHHHFLKQWVKSCSYILAKTDSEEVEKYELENILTEYYGKDGKPSHHELLIKMGISVGLTRKQILTSRPLQKTADAIKLWKNVAENLDWLLILSAMHPLELIASSSIREYGAEFGYFNPAILRDNSITPEAVNFLFEGYSLDVSHSKDALDIISVHADSPNVREECQEVFLASINAFDMYLDARIDRGLLLEGKL